MGGTVRQRVPGLRWGTFRQSFARAGFLALALTAAMMVAGVAHADTRSFPGGTQPPQLPAKYDIKRARISNGDSNLTFRVRLKHVRTKGVTVFARWHMTGEPGWVYEAETHWRNGKKVFRLYVWSNTVDRTKVSCPRKSAHWQPGKDGIVQMKFPSDCIAGPRTWERFEIFTLENGAEEAADAARSRAPLAAG